MKFLQKILHLKATVLPAFAGWAGLAIYFFYNKDLSLLTFRFWHTVLVVFFFSLLSLVYYKFFDYYSLMGTVLTFLATVLVADIIAFTLYPKYLTNVTALDFILSYAFMVATVVVTHIVYHKSWQKKNTSAK